MSQDHGHHPNTATTWHHGLIARWWANFKLDGPEIAFFRSYVESGQPALDVGCGNGRLLVPWVSAGLDVDGVDASADMIEACRVNTYVPAGDAARGRVVGVAERISPITSPKRTWVPTPTTVPSAVTGSVPCAPSSPHAANHGTCD